MGFALSTMQLSSNAFGQGDAIPAKHTGEGADVSPALTWSDAPDGTQSYVILCHDPDAPLVQNGAYGYVHWVLYNLPADVTSLEEASTLGTSGLNDFGKPGYGGPMPPNGHGVHHYYFWVLALDSSPNLPEGLTMVQLLAEIEPHLLGMNRLVGTYKRD